MAVGIDGGIYLQMIFSRNDKITIFTVTKYTDASSNDQYMQDINNTFFYETLMIKTHKIHSQNLPTWYALGVCYW